MPEGTGTEIDPGESLLRAVTSGGLLLVPVIAVFVHLLLVWA